MGVSVGVLDHFNIRTRKLAETVRFYRGRPGAGEGRPAELCFPRRVDVQRGQAGRASRRYFPTDEPQKPDSGVVHHVAFVSRGF